MKHNLLLQAFNMAGGIWAAHLFFLIIFLIFFIQAVVYSQQARVNIFKAKKIWLAVATVVFYVLFLIWRIYEK